ncbi:integral membrane protein CcmA involved in cell shape determination [gamma proteobacterium HTCC5015]|nr:integral membrane protein CcmA involved in cell shape determination [gamma proteobacterium HTCC5015]
MWGSSSKFKSAKLDTMVGPNTEVRGDVVFEGCLHVDGVVKGNITAKDTESSMLTLNRGGRVEGEIHVPNLLIDGEVEGDVYASNRVELSTHAEVSGNVYYNLLEMAMGASINGNLVHRPRSEMRLLEHQAEDGELEREQPAQEAEGATADEKSDKADSANSAKSTK